MKYFGGQALREDVTYVFTEYLWTKKCIVSTVVTIVLLVVIIAVAVVLSSEKNTSKPPIPPPPPMPPPSIQNVSSTDTDYGDVPIVRRSEWGALLSKDETKLESLPPEYVIIAHTAGTFCRSKDHCIKVVREIQEQHVWVNHWTDIGYNFLVGGDGRIYEGCKWDVEGAHTYKWNKKSIGVAFTGDYRFDRPMQAQVDALNKLLTLGVKQKKLKENYKVLAHLQVTSVLSPGEHLYNVIKTWKHWSKCPNLTEPELCPS